MGSGSASLGGHDEKEPLHLWGDVGSRATLVGRWIKTDLDPPAQIEDMKPKRAYPQVSNSDFDAQPAASRNKCVSHCHPHTNGSFPTGHLSPIVEWRNSRGTVALNFVSIRLSLDDVEFRNATVQQCGRPKGSSHAIISRVTMLTAGRIYRCYDSWTAYETTP